MPRTVDQILAAKPINRRGDYTEHPQWAAEAAVRALRDRGRYAALLQDTGKIGVTGVGGLGGGGGVWGKEEVAAAAWASAGEFAVELVDGDAGFDPGGVVGEDVADVAAIGGGVEDDGTVGALAGEACAAAAGEDGDVAAAAEVDNGVEFVGVARDDDADGSRFAGAGELIRLANRGWNVNDACRREDALGDGRQE